MKKQPKRAVTTTNHEMLVQSRAPSALLSSAQFLFRLPALTNNSMMKQRINQSFCNSKDAFQRICKNLGFIYCGLLLQLVEVLKFLSIKILSILSLILFSYPHSPCIVKSLSRNCISCIFVGNLSINLQTLLQ